MRCDAAETGQQRARTAAALARTAAGRARRGRHRGDRSGCDGDRDRPVNRPSDRATAADTNGRLVSCGVVRDLRAEPDTRRPGVVRGGRRAGPATSRRPARTGDPRARLRRRRPDAGRPCGSSAPRRAHHDPVAAAEQRGGRSSRAGAGSRSTRDSAVEDRRALGRPGRILRGWHRGRLVRRRSPAGRATRRQYRLADARH